MSTLSDLLDDVARAEPVVAPDLGRRAWRQGRRDLVRERVGAGAAVAAVLALLALVAPVAGIPVEAPLADRATAVTGYPEQVGRQLWVRELPDRPGPVAALLQAPRFDDPVGGWYAVAPDGHRWRLPGTAYDDQVPALSRDGRLLAHLLSQDGPLVVHDLVTGERRTFPEFGGHAAFELAQPYQQTGQSPALFSPDGRHLLLTGWAGRGEGGRLLLDVASGDVVPLEGDDLGFPAGWVGDDRIVWLGGAGPQGEQPRRSTATTTDLTGRVLSRVPLPGAQAGDQWAGLASPDGRSLLVLSDGSFGSDAAVRRYELPSGRLVAQTPLEVETCGKAWPARRGPVVTRHDDDALAVVALDGGGTSEVARVDASVGGHCLLWAADALNGKPHGGLTRWSRDPTLQAGVAGLLVVAALVLLRRRVSAAARRARR